MTQYTSFTATSGPTCKHNNGWWATVRFWIFKKRVFVCSDCGEVIEGTQP